MQGSSENHIKLTSNVLGVAGEISACNSRQYRQLKGSKYGQDQEELRNSETLVQPLSAQPPNAITCCIVRGNNRKVIRSPIIRHFQPTRSLPSLPPTVGEQIFFVSCFFLSWRHQKPRVGSASNRPGPFHADLERLRRSTTARPPPPSNTPATSSSPHLTFSIAVIDPRPRRSEPPGRRQHQARRPRSRHSTTSRPLPPR